MSVSGTDVGKPFSDSKDDGGLFFFSLFVAVVEGVLGSTLDSLAIESFSTSVDSGLDNFTSVVSLDIPIIAAPKAPPARDCAALVAPPARDCAALVAPPARDCAALVAPPITDCA